MKIQHFEDTDTLFIQLTNTPIAETQELNENTLLDIDANGNLVSVTLEHASQQSVLPNLVYEQLPIDEAA